MKNANSMSRRQFLRVTSTAAVATMAVPYFIPGRALGADGGTAASERIAVGCIGVGPQGTGDMSNFLGQNDCRVVAVCDVKKNVLEEVKNLVNKHYNNQDCKPYGDFRELVARKDIDACLIATCDHWHVLTALAAVRSGKDVYVEKPLGISVVEDQVLRTEVNRNGRIFQFGTQQRSSWQFRHACELVRNKTIGDLKSIRAWCVGSSAGGSPKPVPVPEWLDYDFWLGQAPMVPYTEDRCSNKYWWFISDYALGYIAGWGIHPLDIALWGGQEKMECPVEVEGKATFPTEGVCDTALTWEVKMKYQSGLEIDYRALPSIPDEWKTRYRKPNDHGTAFEGSDGWVHVDRVGINTFPENLAKHEFGPNDVRLIKSDNHVRNFLDSIKSRAKSICPIEDSVQGDILCHISDIATRLGQKLTWDTKAERFVNNATANRMLSRSMRAPWKLS
ncbi:MAG: Gfo/Idh/MocA family oxidoreductase [Phycisphaerae bacterium]|nr:Gfo/Idh/MocA family oxidoreductase [Phycisphaerae bacterium]